MSFWYQCNFLSSLGLAAFLSWGTRAKRGDPDKWCHNDDDDDQQRDQSEQSNKNDKGGDNGNGDD